MELMNLAIVAAFAPLVGASLAGFLGWKLGRTFAHTVDGQQAEEPLRILVLALICELDAPLRVLLEKTYHDFHFIPRRRGRTVASVRGRVNSSPAKNFFASEILVVDVPKFH